VLRDGLKFAGIRATIDTERVHHTKIVRAMVVAKKFENLRPSERQDLVGRILDQAFKPEEQIPLSVWTMTPDELAGKWRD
jgi:acid stress-induced BolA-like protein IbaG/YrbA